MVQPIPRYIHRQCQPKSGINNIYYNYTQLIPHKSCLNLTNSQNLPQEQTNSIPLNPKQTVNTHKHTIKSPNHNRLMSLSQKSRHTINSQQRYPSTSKELPNYSPRKPSYILLRFFSFPAHGRTIWPKAIKPFILLSIYKAPTLKPNSFFKKWYHNISSTMNKLFFHTTRTKIVNWVKIGIWGNYQKKISKRSFF